MSAIPKPPVERVIGETSFRVRPLGSKLASKVMLRVTRLFGAALRNGAKTPQAVFASALAEISDADMEFLQTTFAAVTDYSEDGGQKWPGLASHFELFFAANTWQMLQWLGFCLEVNFPDFFAMARTAGVTLSLADLQKA